MKNVEFEGLYDVLIALDVWLMFAAVGLLIARYYRAAAACVAAIMTSVILYLFLVIVG